MMTIDQMIEVLQAAKLAEPLQFRTGFRTAPWEECPQCPSFNFDEYDYRVKPKEPLHFWINEFPGFDLSEPHTSRASADKAARCSNRVRCIHVIQAPDEADPK